MALCDACKAGRHSHDTYGPNAPEVRRGEIPLGASAECPRAVTEAQGDQTCRCPWRGATGGKKAHPLTVRHCPTCRCGGA